MADKEQRFEERLAAVEARVGITPPEYPGKERVITCACGREPCHGELRVIPIKVNGERCVDLMTMGTGGCVLHPEARKNLAALLLQPGWFGD